MRLRKVTALLLILSLCLTAAMGCTKKTGENNNGLPTAQGTTDEPTADVTAEPTSSPSGDYNVEGELTGHTAAEIVSHMRAGFNIGNTLEATGSNYTNIYSQEQSWGNPVISFKLIDSIAEKGFDSVRIPITWYKFISDDGNYTIDPEFLARIKTVVDLCYKHNFYIIINIHHENWVDVSNLDSNYEEIGRELYAVWTQIADYFADYDQHLIFEAMNEPRAKGTDKEWNPYEKGCKAVNYLNQQFVNAVRGNGKGQNGERVLMVPSYAASSNTTAVKNVVLPEYDGKTAENVVVSIHSYTPYNFCLQDTWENFDPTNAQDTRDIDNVFKDLDKYFLSKGIPVIMGETGSTNTKNNTAAREAWSYYFTSKAASYGVPCFIWDNGAKGSSGGECHYYVNRWTGEWEFASIIDKFIEGTHSGTWGSAVGSK